MLNSCRHSLVCFASLMLLVQAGCMSVGPDLEEPSVAVLDEWEATLYGAVAFSDTDGQGDLQFWWTLFEDPVLNRLVEMSRKENPSLRIAGLRVLESRAVLGAAKSTLYPQVRQGTGSSLFTQTERSGGDLPDNTENLVTYQAGLNAAWELDFWGKFRRSVESADAAFFSSVANQQNLQVLLSAQVAELYYRYRTFLLRIQIAKENAEIQKRSYEITDLLYQGGEDSELDLQQAKTQYMATLSNIPGLEESAMRTRNALCALLGRAPGQLDELDETAQELPVIPPLSVQGVPAGLLMRRPDIRAAAWQVATLSPLIGQAKADLYPSIALLGSVGWAGNDKSGSPTTLTLGVGPSFTWNLFDLGAIKNNVRIQDARLQQSLENFQDVVLQAAREIDDAAISVVKTREQQIPQKESTQAAKRSLELANVRYREGYADFQRVIDAQRSVVSQTERAVLNQSEHVAAVIGFYKALGGGWNAVEISEMLPAEILDEMNQRTDWGGLIDKPNSDDVHLEENPDE